MRVFTLSDCDPAGRQMPVSIARKLQALRDLSFPDLEFEVRPIALTPEQVATLELPSTPLKETERRADRWRAAFGIEQTEIDALSTLQPRVFRRIVVDGIAPFFDDTLDRRVRVAERAWEDAAQAVVDQHTDPAFIDTIRAAAQDKLSALRAEIEALNESLWQAVPDDLALPPIEIPAYEIDESLHGKPLVSSDWDWVEQTRALKAHRDYEDEDGDDATVPDSHSHRKRELP